MTDTKCRQCPNGTKYEHYSFLGGYEWDVLKAREITAGRKADRQVTPDELRKYGLQIDPPKVGPNGERYISMMFHSDEHLAHIPEEKLAEPIIFAPIIVGDSTSYILIDGNHRAVRLAREGKVVPAIILTPQESFDCFVMKFTPKDRRRMKLFPGLRTKKKVQHVG